MKINTYNRLTSILYLTFIVYSVMYPNAISTEKIPKMPVVAAPEIKKVVKKQSFEQKEIKCLADNIYHEAQGEPKEGKLAVAFVTLNRVKDKYYPKTVCGVVHQKVKRTCQFSWVCGNSHKINKKAYKDTKKIAESIYKNRKKLYDITNGATMFHANYIDPSWSRSYNRTIEVGNHIFYKKGL